MDTPAAEQQDTNEAQPKQDAQKPPSELFKFSAWLHIGAGAEECDTAELGNCDDPRHFHAWCRLPNQFQHQDIRERALAAKARRMRQLRDQGSDGYEVLESELDELRRGDAAPLVDELLGKNWWRRHLDAMAEIEEAEEYKTIERDRERIAELRLLDEDARPKDEWNELERHMASYDDAVEAARDKIETPLRQAFEGMELAELVDQVREERIAAEASAAFMDSYSKWEWLAGTHVTNDPLTRKARFANLAELEEAAPEVIEGLRSLYADMETSLQRGMRGN